MVTAAGYGVDSGSESKNLWLSSKISLHSGQTGKRLGSREGTHTLPQSAFTGVPSTIASVILSLSA